MAGEWWGGLGFQQQQLAAQQYGSGMLNGSVWQNVYAAGTTVTGGVVNLYAMGADIAPVKAKGPETAVEWLDRRVNEVRVAL